LEVFLRRYLDSAQKRQALMNLAQAYSKLGNKDQMFDVGLRLAQLASDPSTTKGTITGAVLASDGKPVNGAKVCTNFTFREETLLQSCITSTDDAGRFVINHLDAGKYQVFAISPANNNSPPNKSGSLLVKIGKSQPWPNITLYLENNREAAIASAAKRLAQNARPAASNANGSGPSANVCVSSDGIGYVPWLVTLFNADDGDTKISSSSRAASTTDNCEYFATSGEVSEEVNPKSVATNDCIRTTEPDYCTWPIYHCSLTFSLVRAKDSQTLLKKTISLSSYQGCGEVEQSLLKNAVKQMRAALKTDQEKQQVQNGGSTSTNGPDHP
jgi:hypothetical protein